MSILARRASGVSASRSGRLPSPRTRRLRARFLAESRTMKRRRSGRCRDAGRCGRRGRAERPAETQTAVLPLVPYLDTLRWVFIAVALVGIAVTIYARLDDWKGGGGDRRACRQLVGSAWARAVLRYGVTPSRSSVPAALRRSGERAGRLAERLETREKANEVQTKDAGGGGSPSS